MKKITSKKARGNQVDFLTIKITSAKVRGNSLDFSTIQITSKKVSGDYVDFSISEITSKKYLETTQKFVEIWSSTYPCNIHVESTSIRHGVPVGLVVMTNLIFNNQQYEVEIKQFICVKQIRCSLFSKSSSQRFCSWCI